MAEAEYLTDTITLYQGDCLEVLLTLPKGIVDCVVTDPPYGVNLGVTNDQRQDKSHLGKRGYSSHADTYEMFVSEVVPRLNIAIGLAKRSVVFTGPNIHEQKKPSVIGGIYCPAAIGRTPWGFKNFLPILLYGIAVDLNKGSKHTVLNSTATAGKHTHPCVKPIEWMIWLLKLASRPGDTILDPFAGSGTTAVAAMLENRKCIVIERDPTYCEIIRKRVRDASGVAPGSLFHGVGNLFDN